LSAPLPRDHIPSLEPYKLAERGSAGRPLIRLDQNENAADPSPAAMAAAQAALLEVNRYPEGDAASLRAAVAETEGLPAEQIICGAGSMELLGLIAQAYLRPGDEAVVSRYGYLYFRSVAQANGGSAVLAPERGLSAEVDALLASVTARTRILFLANPNNPTGTLLRQDEIHRLRAGLREDIILVLDAAYAEYVGASGYDPGAALVAAGSNTVMLRSFSKIHGLAGLRVGWGYFPAEIGSMLNRIRHPNGVSAPGIAAAAAAIRDRTHIAAVRRANADIRDWFIGALRPLGFEAGESHGNFLLLPFADAAAATVAYGHLKGEGIMLRPMNGYGLSHYLRVTLGMREEMEQLLQALADWREGGR
jgi:histidinol-phosphate aminotransferase